VKFTTTYPMHVHPCHPDFASANGVATLAKAAEAAGFSGFGFTDHPAPTQRWLEAGGHDALDPFVAMSFAAAHTTTMRLIPNIVVLPYRNPFIVAKAGATLDVLSGGRFTLAVGAGYLKGEYAALGVSHADRNELFDEALDAIRTAWTQDDVAIEGSTFSARGITAHPRPLAAPHPPIWIGGNSGRARQRVVDFGQGWCPFPAAPGLAQTARTVALNTLELLDEAIADLYRRMEAAGRDPGELDITYAAGSDASTEDFDADEHLEGLAARAALGVTWVQVGLPGDSLDRALDTIERYGKTVISRV
jgi:probable F420-dependent oxidoreductase